MTTHLAGLGAPILRVVRREETTVRLDVLAAYFAMTWGPDDTQFSVFADGVDLGDPPTQAYHSRIYEILGDPPSPGLREVAGYPDMPMRLVESHYASFWGSSCLSVDGTLYQLLQTSNQPYMRSDGGFADDFYLSGVKLIFSPDGGATWHNQDGSTPLVWEDWDARSRENMLFFDEEPEGALTWLTFLQMGKDYGLNDDGYVYIYGGDGIAPEDADRLVLIRTPASQVADRASYEYFSGRTDDGAATWTTDISRRAPVHTFPPGWVSGKMPGAVPSGWWTSVVYNAPLGVYLMAAQGTGQGNSGGWFGTPSYLGFWTAPTPWGPFTRIHEERAWTPGGDPNSRAFAPQIPPKWISDDGRSFWLVWSDYGSLDGGPADKEFNPDREAVDALKDITDDAEFARALKTWNDENQLAGFRMQRLDLLSDELPVPGPSGDEHSGGSA